MVDRGIKWSRRTLLLNGTAIAMAPILTVGQAPQSSSFGSLSASGRHVAVTTSNDADFTRNIEALYPKLTSDPRFQQLFRLSMLLTHTRGPSIRAFTSCWSVTTPNGTTEIPLFHYSKAGSRRAGIKSVTIASAQRNVLEQGRSSLITPFFSMTPERYQRLGSDWHRLVQYREPAAFLARELPSAIATRASIDSVVFQDRTFFGPNNYPLVARLRYYRKAERDLAGRISEELSAGASSSSISALLDEYAEGELPVGSPTNRWYRSARRGYAQFLSGLQQSLDPDVFSKVVARAATLKHTRHRKIAA